VSKVEVLSKGQITIPKEVRDALKVDTGDMVLFEVLTHKEVRLLKGTQKALLKNKSTLTEKGQVTIPKSVREELNLQTGDILIFHWVNEGIYFRKQGELIPCPACHGKGTFETYNLPCFVCDQTAYIEKQDNGILFLLFFNNKFRKYKVANTLIQQELKQDGTFQYRDVPKLLLRSNEYPLELMNQVQDRLQMILVEEHSPKSVSDQSKFMIPTDTLLHELLELFVTEEAKETVRNWFRFERTI
jgi:AbrB family looped-hinge helix DNA binding protein